MAHVAITPSTLYAGELSLTDTSNLSAKIRGSINLLYQPSQFLGMNCMLLLLNTIFKPSKNFKADHSM
jgi:hypothetical protein